MNSLFIVLLITSVVTFVWGLIGIYFTPYLGFYRDEECDGKTTKAVLLRAFLTGGPIAFLIWNKNVKHEDK